MDLKFSHLECYKIWESVTRRRDMSFGLGRLNMGPGLKTLKCPVKNVGWRNLMRNLMAFLFVAGVVGCGGSPAIGPIAEQDPANVPVGSEVEKNVDEEVTVQLTALEKAEADLLEAEKPSELIVSFSSSGDMSLEEIASKLRGHSEWESLIRRSKKTVAPPSSLPPGMQLDPVQKRLKWKGQRVPQGKYEISVFVIYVDSPKPKTSKGAKFQKKGIRGSAANQNTDEKRREWKFRLVVE